MSAPDQFAAMAPAQAIAEHAAVWNDLLASSAADTIFLTPEWMRAWHDAYGASRQGTVVLAYRNRALSGLFPLQVVRERYRGALPIRALRLLGDGTYDSDYLDFILPRGEESETLAAFAAWMEESPAAPRFDIARWNEMPAEAPSYRFLRQQAERRGTFLEEERVGCVFLRLPTTWDEYLAMLKPRMRTKVRSLRRELEAKHRVALSSCATEAEIDPRLDSLFRLHALRWERRGQSGVFHRAEKRAFYRSLARALLPLGRLRFDTLEVDGQPVAHQFCVGYKGTVYLLQEGYHPEWEERGVGNVLRSMVLQQLIQEGCRTYDFLGGVSQHKLSWGGEVKESARLALRGPGMRGALLAGTIRLAAALAPLRARWARRGA